MNEYVVLRKIGSRIKTIRVSKKLTQNDLANECNFEKANLSRIESGQTNLTIRSLYKICTALEINVDELFKE